MKTLRIFIGDKLGEKVQWCFLEDNKVVDTGNSDSGEIALFEAMPLEVYLSPSCCSVFKLNVTGIKAKNLTDELVLGLIEDSLADDITQIKPLVMSGMDDIIYVAVFNLEFFTLLMDFIYSLNKPIRFIQSFVYATLFTQGSWTVFLSNNHSFVRTSTYQYYLLDDSKPVPALLTEMLLDKENPPSSLLVYNVDEIDLTSFISRVNTPTDIVNDEYHYGTFVWNFYNQKSSNFNLKLDVGAKKSLLSLLHMSKYFFAFLLLFWFMRAVTLGIDNARIKSSLAQLVHSTDTENSKMKLNKLRQEIIKDEHDRALYADNDAVPLLRKFLQIVSSIDQNTITAIDYSDHRINIFVNNNFKANEFSSYRHILVINHINASIDDYKIYAKKLKDSEDKSANSDNNGNLKISDDTAWVIILQSLLQEENNGTKSQSD